MDLGNTSQALTPLDEDEKRITTLGTNEGLQTQGVGPQSFNVINETGLYSLILTSRRKEAKRFKRWVTQEVLPSIRKTGSYSLAGASPESGSAWQVFFRKGYAPTPSGGVESKLPINDPGSEGSAHWDGGGQRQAI
jgi:prophage antirepressor-like protein